MSQCPPSLTGGPRVVMGHGGGGRLAAELLESVFLPALDNPYLRLLTDAAVLPRPEQGRLAFCTDASVVSPLFFPGGSIGSLAVHGTLNDLAMMGARPLYLSCAFILEEGLELEVLRRVVADLAEAARACRVLVVCGDTKVVEKGHGDGVFLVTSGLGVVPDGLELDPRRVQAGDVILLSGPIGAHGVALLSQRQGLQFDSPVLSDSAPLHGLVEELLRACPEVRVLRDPTRGGVAAVLHELARGSGLAMEIEEAAIPLEEAVASACELLGLDPLHVANEGRLLALVPQASARSALAALRGHPLGTGACVLGKVVAEPVGRVLLRTRLGALRRVERPLHEPLPRIC